MSFHKPQINISFVSLCFAHLRKSSTLNKLMVWINKADKISSLLKGYTIIYKTSCIYVQARSLSDFQCTLHMPGVMKIQKYHTSMNHDFFCVCACMIHSTKYVVIHKLVPQEIEDVQVKKNTPSNYLITPSLILHNYFLSSLIVPKG